VLSHIGKVSTIRDEYLNLSTRFIDYNSDVVYNVSSLHSLVEKDREK
jgi:hypothetical protein